MRRRCAAPDSCRQDLMTTTTASSGDPAWVEDVLRFWFEELAEIDWFVRDDDVDARIRKRFLALHGKIVADGGVPLTSTPRALLAAVIVLDQFSRNLYRDDPRAFAADADARQLARSITTEYNIMNSRMVHGVCVDPTTHLVAGLQQRFAMLDDEHRVAATTQLLAFSGRQGGP